MVPHQPAWARAFDILSAELDIHLPPGSTIHHIGSTAVPGLAAKPILDVAVAANPIHHDAIATVLTGLGWIDRGDRSGRLFIRQRDPGLRTHNLHLYELSSSELTDQLTFRDRLRADPALRDAYAAHKQSLIDGGCPRPQYANAKTDFIRSALGQKQSADHGQRTP